MKKYLFKSIAVITAAILGCLCTAPFVAASGADKTGNGGGGMEIFISPDGNDSASGTIDAPLKTIEAAKEKLKTVGGNEDELCTVYMREGTYYIPEVVEFTCEDRDNVLFKAYNGESVTVSGAREIRGFSEETVNGVRAFVKQLDTTAQNWYFNSLFNEKTTLKTPRFPEDGYFTVASLNTDDSCFTEENTPWSLTTGQRSFNASLSDVRAPFYNQSDVVVRILHYWKDEMMFVTGFDAQTGRVSLSRPSSMSISNIDRYYFENVFEALNSPGEWYLDRVTGKLYYIPCEGETPDTLTLYASDNDTLISIDGTDGIGFEGIVFRNTAWSVPKVSEDEWGGSWRHKYDVDALQAAYDVEGAVRVENADAFSMKNCELLNIGTTALKMKQNVTNSSVESCYFENIGATGIYIGGDNVARGADGSTANITVHNCEIYKYGRIFFNAIGIHITYCDSADISDNEIHDGYYTGISCGWTWGYSFHSTENIKIKNNLIYQIGQGWLSDMGGIYMLGKQLGTEISGNIIHDVAADAGAGGYGGWGIYLDEGSSYMLVEKNLVFSCGSQGLNIHYGRENIISNNIIALNSQGQIRLSQRDENFECATLYNNIILTDNKAPAYLHMQNTGHFSEHDNLIWDMTNENRVYFEQSDISNDALSLSDALAMCYLKNPVVENPCFTDAAGFDFTLPADSPAFKTGFTAWNYSEAGTDAGSVIGVSREGGLTSYSENAQLRDFASTSRGLLFVRLFRKLYELIYRFMSEHFSWFPLW